MKLNDAVYLANYWMYQLNPYFDVIKIAGSIRREKPDNIKDIELVGIPLPGRDLFYEPTLKLAPIFGFMSQLEQDRKIMVEKRGQKYIKFMDLDRVFWIDLFLATPENFGYLLALRTGPAEFSKKIVTPKQADGFMPSNLKAKNGYIWKKSTRLSIPDEHTLFQIYGMDYIKPQDRE